jgi:hypothetical protein
LLLLHNNDIHGPFFWFPSTQTGDARKTSRTSMGNDEKW